MKIVYFGSPESSRQCLSKIRSAGFDIRLVITQPDRPAGRGKRHTPSPVKRLAEGAGIPIHQAPRIRKDPEVLTKLEKIQPDLNVVVAYGQIIPAEIIYFPRYNSINLHFSLLPRYRGASPVQWAILNGEDHTGVSIFELNEKMDEGPILTQTRVEILPEDTAQTLERRLVKTGAELLVETMFDIAKLTPTPQDHEQATFAPLIKKEDGRIEWDREAAYIARQVRAFHPWPSTFIFFQEKRIKILTGRPVTGFPESDSRPGEIVGLDPSGIAVRCGGSSAFRIENLQPENKQAMTAHAFSLGARLSPGDRFD